MLFVWPEGITIKLWFSYESEFLQKLVKDKKIHEARAFNFTNRYIDDVLSINNSRFAEFLPLIYPPELEVIETTDTASSASFLDLYLEFDDSGQISTKIYYKRDDFNFKATSSGGGTAYTSGTREFIPGF